MVRIVWGRGDIVQPAAAGHVHMPSHVPSGAALLAVELSEDARGTRGLDVLRRSIDRAPPARS